MRQHSALNRGLMFDWLKDLDDTGDRCPSDDAIMERFDFDTPEQARTLLADLADKGLITVRGAGADRVVTIGKEAHRPAPAARPVPSVVKQPPSVDAGVAKIMSIVGRAPEPVPTAPAFAEEWRDEHKLVPAKLKPTPVSLPDPPRTRFQVNLKVSADQFGHLTTMAEAEDIAVGRVALRFFEQGMAGATPEPIHKPLIRAHVIRAARDAGIPIEEFVASLIECGLQRFLSGQTAEIAA